MATTENRADGGCGELLGDNEMLERDRRTGFGMKPAVGDDGDDGDDGDVVVRGYGLKHWCCESDVVVVFCVPLAKDGHITEQGQFRRRHLQ